MSPDRTLIIIPTYNERENIPVLLERLAASVPEADILIVDDSSPDGTAGLAEEILARRAGGHVLRRTGPRGLGRSYVDG